MLEFVGGCGGVCIRLIIKLLTKMVFHLTVRGQVYDVLSLDRGIAMSTSARLTRQKISTTISPTALSYLERLIEKGEVQNLAQAIDLAINRLLAFENRERLERDTAAYFDNMSPEQSAEEERLAAALSQSARGVDFDREP